MPWSLALLSVLPLCIVVEKAFQYVMEEFAVNVNDMCSVILKRIMNVKSKHIKQLMKRCLEIDSWEPLSATIVHSSSVVDLCHIFYTITEDTFQRLAKTAPFGCWEVLFLLTSALEQFGAQSINDGDADADDGDGDADDDGDAAGATVGCWCR